MDWCTLNCLVIYEAKKGSALLTKRIESDMWMGFIIVIV